MISPNVSKWFRGVAILMVIASHYAEWMYVEPENPWLREQVATLGAYGVDIFFLMSGYGLVKSAAKRGIDRSFFLHRLAGSYLPYLLVVGTMMLLDGDFKTPGDVFDFLTCYNYWFMANLLVFYLMFMIFWKIGRAKELLLGAGILGYSFYLYFLGRADFWVVSNGAFLIGVYLAVFEEHKREVLEKPAVKACLFVGSFLGMWYSYRRYLENGGMLWENCTSICYTLLIMSGCILVTQLGKKPGGHFLFRALFSGRVIRTLGTYSLYIYLLHTRLFYFIIFKLGDFSYLLQAAVTGAISIAAALVIGWVLTKGMRKVWLFG